MLRTKIRYSATALSQAFSSLRSPVFSFIKCDLQLHHVLPSKSEKVPLFTYGRNDHLHATYLRLL